METMIGCGTKWMMDVLGKKLPRVRYFGERALHFNGWSIAEPRLYFIYSSQCFERKRSWDSVPINRVWNGGSDDEEDMAYGDFSDRLIGVGNQGVGDDGPSRVFMCVVNESSIVK